MRYPSARNGIKSGDVILWRGRGLAARIVQWITKSCWSHIGVAIWWGNRLMVLDAFPFKGTRARPLSHDVKGAYWLPSGADWNQKALAFALDELDRQYSFQNLWKTLLGLNLVKRQYHCAQYVAEVLDRAGVFLTAPPTPESIAREVSIYRSDAVGCGTSARDGGGADSAKPMKVEASNGKI
jgi:hypothetical protein